MKRLILSFLILLTGTTHAYTNTTLNITACGGAVLGGGYESIGSMCPLGGEGMQSASFYNHSGFTAGFILRPSTAFSCLADEWNPDNDRDGLEDDKEILVGSSLYNRDTDEDGLSDPDEVNIHKTSPILADTDDDRMDDSQELIAGTSPTNQYSVLTLTGTFPPNGTPIISWFGVKGRTYTIQCDDSLNSGRWQSYISEIDGLDEVISFEDVRPTSNRFYRVQVRVAE